VSLLNIIEISAFMEGFGVTPVLVATRRPVEGSPGDFVACVSYEFVRGAPRRWAVVQRVGPVWSATLDLDHVAAAARATAIARREAPRDAQLPPGGPDAGA
jgi:hypothetical protein